MQIFLRNFSLKFNHLLIRSTKILYCRYLSIFLASTQCNVMQNNGDYSRHITFGSQIRPTFLKFQFCNICSKNKDSITLKSHESIMFTFSFTFNPSKGNTFCEKFELSSLRKSSQPSPVEKKLRKNKLIFSTPKLYLIWAPRMIFSSIFFGTSTALNWR